MTIDLRWKQCYTWTLIVLAFLVATGYGGYKYGVKQGITLGLTGYHSQCLVGGIVIDEEGKAIKCAPLGQVPKEELEKFKL